MRQKSTSVIESSIVVFLATLFALGMAGGVILLFMTSAHAQSSTWASDQKEMLKESEAPLLLNLTMIEVGHRCGILYPDPAPNMQVAIVAQKLSVYIADQRMRMGVGDISDLRGEIQEAVNQGKLVAAQDGLCGRIPAADRARIRTLAITLFSGVN
jgi:hypothetical protein